MPRIFQLFGRRLTGRRPALALSAALGLASCPAPEEEAPALPASELAPWALEVEAARAQTGRLFVRTVRTGFLEPGQATRIAPEVAGTVAARAVDDGDRVEAGQLLFRLDDGRQRTALRSARAALAGAEADLAFLQADKARKEQLVERNAAPALQLESAALSLSRAEAGAAQARAALENAERALADTVIRAPHAGVVHERQVDVGDQVAPGRPLLELVDLGRVRLAVGVTGPVASRLEAGRELTVRVDDLGGLPLPGRIVAIAPRADPRTGLFEVLVEAAPDPEAGVRAGMVGRVALVEEGADAVLVPRRALVREEGTPAVFVVEDGRAARRPVRTGRIGPRRVEIPEGLEAGEVVALSALHALTDGARVEIRLVEPPVAAGPAGDEAAGDAR